MFLADDLARARWDYVIANGDFPRWMGSGERINSRHAAGRKGKFWWGVQSCDPIRCIYP